MARALGVGRYYLDEGGLQFPSSIICKLLILSLFIWRAAADSQFQKNVSGGLQKFVSTPSNQTVALCSRAELTCVVENKVGDVQWTRDEFGLGYLEGYDRYTMPGQNDSGGNYSLVIDPVTTEDDAVFECQVLRSELSKGLRSPVAKLTVEIRPKPPTIVLESNDSLESSEEMLKILRVKEGNKVILKCQVLGGGSLAPELTWLDGMGRIITEGINYTSDPEEECSVTTSTLIFEAHNEHNNETISCHANFSSLENVNDSMRDCISLLVICDQGLTTRSGNDVYSSTVLWSVFGITGMLLITIVVATLICHYKNNLESIGPGFANPAYYENFLMDEEKSKTIGDSENGLAFSDNSPMDASCSCRAIPFNKWDTICLDDTPGVNQYKVDNRYLNAVDYEESFKAPYADYSIWSYAVEDTDV